MTLLEVAKWLKKEIRGNFSNQNLDSIIQELNKMNLTEKQIDFIYQYCHFAGYDEKTKAFLVVSQITVNF